MYETVAGGSPARGQLIHVVYVVYVVHAIRVVESILYESFQRLHHSLSYLLLERVTHLNQISNTLVMNVANRHPIMN